MDFNEKNEKVIPSFKNVLRTNGRIVGVFNLAGAIVAFFYFSVIDPPPQGQQSMNTGALDGANLLVFASFMIFTVILGNVWGKKKEKGIEKWYKELRRGVAATAVPKHVRRDVLNWPIQTAVVSLAIWGVAGIFFALTSFGDGWGNNPYRVFIGISGVVGLPTAVLIFYAIDAYLHPLIILFFPDGDIKEAGGFRLSILGRLLIPFLLIGLWSPTLLVLTASQRAQLLLTAPNPQTVLNNLFIIQGFILVLSLITAAAIAIFMTRGITLPLDTLQAEMQEVERGNLEAHIAVTSADELGYLGQRFNQMTIGLRQGEMLRNLLNLYVSPEVAREALEHGAELGGKEVICSALFADIRDFTTITEQLPPAALIKLLNRYMSAMVEAVTAHGGIVNKFGGDSLLAVFGSPLNPNSNHAAKATMAAQAMLAALTQFNQIQQEAGSVTLRIGVGIATGPVIAGNVGGRERLEYTVIGDTVNLASRLQDKTKEFSGDVLLSEETYRQASQGMTLDVEEETAVQVKGKVTAVSVYALKT